MSEQQNGAKPKSTKAINDNALGRSGGEKDFLHTAQGARGFAGEKKNLIWNEKVGGLVAKLSGRTLTARYVSPLIPCKFPATEFLPSWNIKLLHKGQSYAIYLRVGDESQVKFSPWFLLGEGGGTISEKPVKTKVEAWGESRIDYLHLVKPASVFQYKVELTAESGSDEESPALHRFFVHYSGPGATGGSKPETAKHGQTCRVEVPYRSQLDVEPEALRHIICCPTCVSMVLERLGVDKPTLSICEDVYDARHKMYGVWPKAAQAAFQHGGRAWVDRFRSLGAVREYLETGHPIIASIRVGEGELRGARYPKSNGHLIVITGYNGNDKIRVNDPYSVGPTGGEIEYESADIEKVWLDKGGVAILIEPEIKK